MKWTVDRIRDSFLEFFAGHGHLIVPSAPLIPQGDPTLLFTNAGMVQFKDYFLGLRTPPSKRIADCQKCLRISGKHNDLEAVGRDDYHHTFFEMLGNWSFGDYYKAQAIAFHWELVTQVWKIPVERLWATVYVEDDEAEQAWLELKVLERDRVLRFGQKDNFWEMGDVGPCGPCTEIHFDRGTRACSGAGHPGKPCAVNLAGCTRFIELANLVFIQYDRDKNGALSPLPLKHVDTGAGLERIAAVLQSLESGRLLGNYDTDLFQTIIRRIEQVSVKAGNCDTYGSSERANTSYRAIADHARAVSFLVAEGLRPGNTEREYVLRRLIRRAARHGLTLGVQALDELLAQACHGVVEAMGGAYPELRGAAGTIDSVVREEVNRFKTALVNGKQFLEQALSTLTVEKDGRRVLPGEVAFKLYDTYGFPLDLTEDILRDEGVTLERAGFEELMQAQRERARAARDVQAASSGATVGPQIVVKDSDKDGKLKSVFVGYDRLEGDSKLVAARRNNGTYGIITAETPFYPEGGGQVGDRGTIELESGATFEVYNTVRQGNAIVHVARLVKGEAAELEEGRRLTLKVDRQHREAAMLNHSATHILHAVLRERLGKTVRQAGSLVAPDRLRFDFTYTGPIGEDELFAIERDVNAHIREDAEVVTEEMPYDEAIKAGALAFFGDKYGDIVRVVRIGDFSLELCGGTHVRHTGQIGLFKLEAESGIGAGVRRVEAVTGQGALAAVREREKILEQIGQLLRTSGRDALTRLERLLEREKELERRIRSLEQKLVGAVGATQGQEEVQEVRGIKVITQQLEGVEAPALRQLADRLREKYGSAVVVLGSKLQDKALLVAAVTPDLVGRVHAGELIKKIAPTVGGAGGGRADFAQAGGRLAEKLTEALKQVPEALA